MKNGLFILRGPSRTNGGVIEIIRDFPFMLSGVEAFLGFFQQVHC